MLLKSAAPHLGKDLDAMKATATALKERSLEMFKTTLKDYQERESVILMRCHPISYRQNCSRTR